MLASEEGFQESYKLASSLRLIGKRVIMNAFPEMIVPVGGGSQRSGFCCAPCLLPDVHVQERPVRDSMRSTGKTLQMHNLSPTSGLHVLHEEGKCRPKEFFKVNACLSKESNARLRMKCRNHLGMYFDAFRLRGAFREMLDNWPSRNVQIVVSHLIPKVPENMGCIYTPGGGGGGEVEKHDNNNIICICM